MRVTNALAYVLIAGAVPLANLRAQQPPSAPDAAGELAEAALIELLADAFHVPKHRISTTPTQAAVRRRLEAKRRRSLTKSRRGVVEREP